MKRRVGVITPIVNRPDLVKMAEEMGLTDVRCYEFGAWFVQGYKGKAIRHYVEEDGKLRRIS